MATSQSEEAATLLQSALNALPMQVAVLDRAGIIRYTNRAWRTFGTANGLEEPITEGTNYLGICESADDPTGRAAAEGIRAVLAGSRDGFSLEYDCHGPDEKRWFQMEVTRFDAPLDGPTGGRNALVAHLDVTDRKLAERTETDGREETLGDDAGIDERVSVDVGTLARSVWAASDTGEATLAVESTAHLYADQRLLSAAFRSLFSMAVAAGHERVRVLTDGETTTILGGEDVTVDAADTEAAIAEDETALRRVVEAHGWSLEVTDDAVWGVRLETADSKTQGGD